MQLLRRSRFSPSARRDRDQIRSGPLRDRFVQRLGCTFTCKRYIVNISFMNRFGPAAYLAVRAIVRHGDKWFGFSPWPSATSFTVAPGLRLSETIMVLTSSGHCRCPPRPTVLAVRIFSVVSVETTPLLVHGRSITDHYRRATWGKNTGYVEPLRGAAELIL